MPAPNLYDIYNYSEGPLTEFTTMCQLPTNDDVAEFVDAACLTVERAEKRFPTKSQDSLRFINSCLFLPEGLVTVSKIVTNDEIENPKGVRAHLEIYRTRGDDSKFHEADVTQVYSELQRLQLAFARGPTGRTGLPYSYRPTLSDYGVTEEDDINDDAFDALLEQRADIIPDDLVMPPGVSAEDFMYLEHAARSTGLAHELMESGDSSAFDVERYSNPPTTIVGRPTLQTLTGLLLHHLPSSR